MRLRSPPGGKTDAQNESVALRSGLPVLVVHVGSAGRSHQDDGPRAPAIRGVYVRMLSAGAVRDRLGDVPGARVSSRALLLLGVGNVDRSVARPAPNHYREGALAVVVRRNDHASLVGRAVEIDLHPHLFGFVLI